MVIKVLWVTLRLFSEEKETQSAVWLKSLALQLIRKDEIKLANITSVSGINDTLRCDYENILQWSIPIKKINQKGYPDNYACAEFKKIVDEYAPDIIQIWGSENPFQLMPFDTNLCGLKVLTMQGVMSSIHPILLNGLSLFDIITTIGIREIITRKNLFAIRNSFKKAALIEEMMIKKSQYIITQSEWTDSQIRHLNTNARYFRTSRVLRDEFYNCKKWSLFEHNKPIIYSAAIGYSLKGLHVLIKALAVIKKEIPDIELRLAGEIGRTDFLGEGYLRFIIRLAKGLGVYSNIKWLGAITSSEIVRNLQEASVFVNPSYVESYSMVVAEAMAVGTPSVISFTGAMPELAVHKVDAVFFSPGDYHQLSYYAIMIINKPELAKSLSISSASRTEARNIEFDTAENQLSIYKEIINKSQV